MNQVCENCVRVVIGDWITIQISVWAILATFVLWALFRFFYSIGES